jgi:Ino eighty subunit 2
MASHPLLLTNLTNAPAEVQVKKHLTAEEHAMRRAEMARRRKNLSEKRNEEEKVR